MLRVSDKYPFKAAQRRIIFRVVTVYCVQTDMWDCQVKAV